MRALTVPMPFHTPFYAALPAGVALGHFAAEGHDVTVVPVYMVSDDPAATILDISATLGVDILILGTPHWHALTRLLKGNVVTEVAKNLPENIQLVIYG